MLLFIDNFDSFTYNLIQYFQILGIETQVIRSQSCSFQECLTLNPCYLVIGPGPGAPAQASFSSQLLLHYADRIPILGVCLGHQILAEVYGGRVIRASTPMHGKTSVISHCQKGLFHHIPQNFSATRYHSLIVEKHSLPDCLEITAETNQQEIMALRHRRFAIESVQFHPESILTEHGLSLLRNFLDTPSFTR